MLAFRHTEGAVDTEEVNVIVFDDSLNNARQCANFVKHIFGLLLHANSCISIIQH